MSGSIHDRGLRNRLELCPFCDVWVEPTFGWAGDVVGHFLVRIKYERKGDAPLGLDEWPEVPHYWKSEIRAKKVEP